MFASRTNWNLSPNPLSIALAERRAAGKPVLDLTNSNPTECGFNYDGGAILAALANPASLVYDPDPRGLLSARQAVCEYYAARGERVSAEGVVLTTSTSEAYSFAFRLLCNPGDEVLVPQPSYPLFDFLADLQDVRLVRYPLLYDHGWQIDFHALRQAITPGTRGIIVVNPNNPTGNFCKPHEMAQLNEICSAREIAIIADEVFLDYPLTESMSLAQSTPRSFLSSGDALTFTMSGVSKISGLPQMKAAWLIANGPATQRDEALKRLEIVADTYLSMNAPVQHALPVLLQQRRAFQSQLQGRVKANLAELDRQIAGQRQDVSARASVSGQRRAQEHGSCTRLHLEGGWYAVLAVPANCSGDELAMRLLESHGIHVHPGHYYDFANPLTIVLSLLTPPDEFSAGIVRLIECAAGFVG